MQVQEIVQKANINEAMMEKLKGFVVNGLKITPSGGVDTTPFTISVAASFKSGAKDANGNQISVGCLLRIEANAAAGALRVTARTMHPLCSLSLKNVVVATIRHLL